MRKWIRVVAIGAALVLLVLLLVGVWAVRASRSMPDFYREALAVEPSVQRDASDQMLQRTAALVSDVKKPGTWRALFTEEQINGWLAVDLVQNHADSLPTEIRSPRVEIEPGHLTFGAQYAYGQIDTVLSATVDVYMADTNELALRLRKVRAGSLPLPMNEAVDAVTETAERLKWPIRWQQVEGNPVAIIAIRMAEHKGHTTRIESVSLEQDAIYLSGTTERVK